MSSPTTEWCRSLVPVSWSGRCGPSSGCGIRCSGWRARRRGPRGCGRRAVEICRLRQATELPRIERDRPGELEPAQVVGRPAFAGERVAFGEDRPERDGTPLLAQMTCLVARGVQPLEDDASGSGAGPPLTDEASEMIRVCVAAFVGHSAARVLHPLANDAPQDQPGLRDATAARACYLARSFSHRRARRPSAGTGPTYADEAGDRSWGQVRGCRGPVRDLRGRGPAWQTKYPQ